MDARLLSPDLSRDMRQYKQLQTYLVDSNESRRTRHGRQRRWSERHCGAQLAARLSLRRQPLMNSSKVYEVIAGIVMIITGLFLGYDEFWGALMLLLGVLLLILWLARMGWML
jgi:hypothetical protein